MLEIILKAYMLKYANFVYQKRKQSLRIMTKKSAVSYQDLVNAYKILFVKSSRVHLGTIQNLQVATLRSTYKKLALQNHPDRSQYIGKNQKILETKFKQISNAYAVLDSFVAGTTSLQYKPETKKRQSEPGTSTTNFRKKPKNKKNKKRNSFSFKHQKVKNSFQKKQERKNKEPDKQKPATHVRRSSHKLPLMEFLLGHYLFYEGHISLKNLIDALQWQRKQRPSFGEIAVNWNIFSKNDVVDILKKRKQGELFGECAHRLKYINAFQYNAILAKQHNQQKPIGKFFVEQGILTEHEIEALHKKLLTHNTLVKRKKTASFR